MRVCPQDYGGLGGFSAPGGIAVNKKMLELERQGLSLDKGLLIDVSQIADKAKKQTSGRMNAGRIPPRETLT